jgi:hypothetical protein
MQCRIAVDRWQSSHANLWGSHKRRLRYMSGKISDEATLSASSHKWKPKSACWALQEDAPVWLFSTRLGSSSGAVNTDHQLITILDWPVAGSLGPLHIWCWPACCWLWQLLPSANHAFFSPVSPSPDYDAHTAAVQISKRGIYQIKNDKFVRKRAARHFYH